MGKAAMTGRVKLGEMLCRQLPADRTKVLPQLLLWSAFNEASGSAKKRLYFLFEINGLLGVYKGVSSCRKMMRLIVSPTHK
jgi:hypothetical protein